MDKKKLIITIALLTAVTVLGGALGIFLLGEKKPGGDNAGDDAMYFTNPVKNVNLPDPFVYRHTDGYYYGTGTTGSNIILYRSDKLTNLFTTGQCKVIWTPPETGDHSRDLWAPEIHYIDGCWYVYYSAGKGDFNQRTFCISNPNPDPFEGEWNDEGKIHVEWADYWAIDGTVLQQNGNLYFVFSSWTAGTGTTQHIFIAQMSSPTKITGRRVKLSSPEYEWEKRVNREGDPLVNEGPQILQKNGKTFIIYSASFCHSPYYCLGMLYCDINADPMNPDNWTKSPEPIFQSGNGIYGPGHCSFTVSPDGTEDWIIYHGRTSTNEEDPRIVFMQKFTWNSDGTPNLDAPAGYGTPLKLPSGQTESGVIILSEHVYRLKNMQFNLFLDVSESSMAEGAPLILADDSNSSSQGNQDIQASLAWKANNHGDGSYSLTALHSGMKADGGSRTANPGTAVQQRSGSRSNTQRWYIVDVGGGYCKIVNKANGLVLTAEEAADGSGIRAVLAEDKGSPNQKWTFEEVKSNVNSNSDK